VAARAYIHHACMCCVSFRWSSVLSLPVYGSKYDLYHQQIRAWLSCMDGSQDAFRSDLLCILILGHVHVLCQRTIYSRPTWQYMYLIDLIIPDADVHNILQIKTIHASVTCLAITYIRSDFLDIVSHRVAGPTSHSPLMSPLPLPPNPTSSKPSPMWMVAPA
jgi:hypothetical protein